MEQGRKFPALCVVYMKNRNICLFVQILILCFHFLGCHLQTGDFSELSSSIENAWNILQTQSVETTAAETEYESCENVYELKRIKQPSDYPFEKIGASTIGDPHSWIYTLDDSIVFYSPGATESARYAVVYDMEGNFCETVLQGEYKKVGLMYNSMIYLRDTITQESIGIRWEDEDLDYRYYVQLTDHTGSVIKENYIHSSENSSLYSFISIDESCSLYFLQGGIGCRLYIIDGDLNVMEPRRIESYPVYGYRYDDERYLFVCANENCYFYTPATDTLEPAVLYEETEAQQKSDTVLYGEDGIYFVNYEGVTVQRDGKDTFLCDFERSYLSSHELEFIRALSGNRFLVWFTDSFTGESYPAILAPTDDDVRPVRKTLRVAYVGASSIISFGHDVSDIENSIAYFNRSNTQYHAELYHYGEAARYDKNGYPYEFYDAERYKSAFAQDLVDGVTYDVYLFGSDYTDRENLAEKGIFADLTALAGKADLLACVRDALTRAEEITAIPFTVTLSTLITTTETLPLGEAFTYEKLFEIMDGLGEGEALFSEYLVENLTDIALYDFVDTEHKTCSYDSEEFVRVLEFLDGYEEAAFGGGKNLVSRHETAYFNDTYGQLSFSYDQYHNYGDILTPFADGTVKFLEFEIDTPKCIPLLYQIFDFIGKDYNLCGYPSADGGSIHMETGLMMSIGKQSENLAGAEAYLSMMLSDAVQTKIAETTFPVVRSVVEKMLGFGTQYYSILTGTTEGTSYKNLFKECMTVIFMKSSIARDTQLERYDRIASLTVLKPEHEAVLSYVCDSSMRGAGDTVIRGIIEEELSYAANGVRTVAEAAKIIQSRVFIYINE